MKLSVFPSVGDLCTVAFTEPDIKKLNMYSDDFERVVGSMAPGDVGLVLGTRSSPIQRIPWISDDKMIEVLANDRQGWMNSNWLQEVEVRK